MFGNEILIIVPGNTQGYTNSTKREKQLINAKYPEQKTTKYRYVNRSKSDKYIYSVKQLIFSQISTQTSTDTTYKN